MKIKIFLMLLLFVSFVSAQSCLPPYTIIGNACCIDEDGDNECDHSIRPLSAEPIKISLKLSTTLPTTTIPTTSTTRIYESADRVKPIAQPSQTDDINLDLVLSYAEENKYYIAGGIVIFIIGFIAFLYFIGDDE